MKRIRATMSILTLAAFSGLMTDAIAADPCIPKATEDSPFVIGFETEDGTTLTPVIYMVENGKLGKRLIEKEGSIKGALKVNGARCGSGKISVNRFYNHDLFYTIEMMPGWYIKIPIPHTP